MTAKNKGWKNRTSAKSIGSAGDRISPSAQWGTVREDYSANGTAWEYFPHDHARSRAYRWGEDGIGGICDRHQRICFALALWNGRDPILKERLFGLTGNEGNHGEDVKEYYFYLDSTPTHSYMKMLYKYPQAEFPYSAPGRGKPQADKDGSGVRADRYRHFRRRPLFRRVRRICQGRREDILIRITAGTAGPEAAPLDLLPTLWFRNTWSLGPASGHRPNLWREPRPRRRAVIGVEAAEYGRRWLLAEGAPELLFTENETNFERLFGVGRT